MGITTRKVLQKRLPTSIEYRYKIVNYGDDNQYPQTVEEISYRSPITESAIATLADFTNGQGFINAGDKIVNRWNQTLNDVLREVTADFSKFDGWALHFNVNSLGLITEITPLKFKNCRFGIPDKTNRHVTIKYSNNWDGSMDIRAASKQTIAEFDRWNGRKPIPEEETADFGGYILYWTPQRDAYPRCTFDSVLDSAQTDGEIQVFELGSIQNSFLGTSIFKHPGKFASDADRNKTIQELGELTGPSNAGSVFLVEVPVGFDGSIIENIPAINNDTLFKTTNENVQARIVARFGIPFPLLGLQPTGGGVFNQEQLKDSYIYYNNRTSNRRNIIVEEFNKFLLFWSEGSIDVKGIKEREFKVLTEANQQANGN